MGGPLEFDRKCVGDAAEGSLKWVGEVVDGDLTLVANAAEGDLKWVGDVVSGDPPEGDLE
jgi:hypothetical protein